MSSRSALILIVTPKETINAKEFLLKHKELIVKKYNIEELLEEHPEDYENMINMNVDCWLHDDLEKDMPYLIFLIRNSAGWPESIDVQLLYQTNDKGEEMLLTYTTLNLPS